MPTCWGGLPSGEDTPVPTASQLSQESERLLPVYRKEPFLTVSEFACLVRTARKQRHQHHQIG